MTPSRAAVAALPKVDLHRHLDGSARPRTLLELAARAGQPPPAATAAELGRLLRADPGQASLARFLERFEIFYPWLRQPGAMGRVARECVLDAAADGVVHLEVRFCPALQAEGPAAMQALVEEVLDGLAAGREAGRITTGLVLCCYRGRAAQESAAIVDLALLHAGRGVVGVDLAGPEAFPGAPHAAALARAREGGLGLTVHAGEAAGPASVAEALDRLGAQRIGHGVALRDDADLARRVADAGVALECCLTSNLLTGAVRSLDEHPFEAFRGAGLRASLHTDDPTVCGVTLTDELLSAARTWSYGLEQLRALGHAAADAAFLDDGPRRALHGRLQPAPGAKPAR